MSFRIYFYSTFFFFLCPEFVEPGGNSGGDFLFLLVLFRAKGGQENKSRGNGNAREQEFLIHKFFVNFKMKNNMKRFSEPLDGKAKVY